MFTGSSTVRTFVIPHVCGTAGQRYFLGKHGQNKTKQKKKVREVPQPDPDAFWVPFYSFQFEFTFFLSGCLFAVGSILNFSSCFTFHPFHPHQWLNAWLLHEQELSLTSILNAYGYSICHFNVDYYLSLCRTFTQADYWLCLSISQLPLHFVFPYSWKHLLCLPQRPPSPPCADVLGASCGFTFPRLPPRRRGLSAMSPVPQENHAADSHLTHLSQQTGHSRVWPASRGRAGFNGGSPAGACSSRTSCCRPLRSTWRRRSRCGKRS